MEATEIYKDVRADKIAFDLKIEPANKLLNEAFTQKLNIYCAGTKNQAKTARNLFLRDYARAKVQVQTGYIDFMTLCLPHYWPFVREIHPLISWGISTERAGKIEFDVSSLLAEKLLKLAAIQNVMSAHVTSLLI